jgi:hypothetical protein
MFVDWTDPQKAMYESDPSSCARLNSFLRLPERLRAGLRTIWSTWTWLPQFFGLSLTRISSVSAEFAFGSNRTLTTRTQGVIKKSSAKPSANYTSHLERTMTTKCALSNSSCTTCVRVGHRETPRRWLPSPSLMMHSRNDLKNNSRTLTRRNTDNSNPSRSCSNFWTTLCR